MTHVLTCDQSLVLDVGCGVTPKGTVNVDFIRSGINLHVGAVMRDPRSIRNFVTADACNLPFKSGAFEIVFSSHVIEHVPNPSIMLSEMCRVSKSKVIVRCPHKRGSGAKRQHHLTYIDEAWFKKCAEFIGLEHSERITAYDFPISNRLPAKIAEKAIKRVLIWRVLRHLEFVLSRGMHIPFEVECRINKE
jgi:ubiquinone/menaquinone biosynthesis C-methylase UbiE